MNAEDVIYLAGLFDGEGTLSIQVHRRATAAGQLSPHFSPRLTMTLYRGTEVLDWAQRTFGGKVYRYANGEVRWYVGRRAELEPLVRLLLPHLRIKKRIAERFLEALDLFPKERPAAIWRGERAWTREQALTVTRIALTLNEYRKSPKTMDYLRLMEEIFE